MLRAAAALCLTTAVLWAVFLGWDRQLPHHEWQVLGVTVSGAAIVAYLRVRRPFAVPVLTWAVVVGLAVPWTINAVSYDDSGLWPIGLLFLIVGTTLGIGLLLTAVAGVTAYADQNGRRG